ncbi:MAG: DNA-3-methyladenine glycosylase I [Pseudomonadota bacterium]
MRHIDEILAVSVERKGSKELVFAGLEQSASQDTLAAIPDDRWLSEMGRAVFQAGFSWKTVDRMWPGFETAFHGFDPGWCSHIEDERFDALVAKTAIVRHGPKIHCIAENARFVLGKTGFGAWVAQFGPERYSELLLALKSEGSRLGGTTGQYFLRSMGVDSWILSRDVSARLVAEGVIDKVVVTKRCYGSIQDAFDNWRGQSGYSLKEISRILATSL